MDIEELIGLLEDIRYRLRYGYDDNRDILPSIDAMLDRLDRARAEELVATPRGLHTPPLTRAVIGGSLASLTPNLGDGEELTPSHHLQ